ncbi:MAG: protein translocase subunit SecF, partial [Clostridia bacterium]
MKDTNKLLTAFGKFNVSKYSKIWFSIPIVVVIIAMIVIIAIGATTGSYSDAVGIGIDFEGGSVVSVKLDNSYEYNAQVDKITKEIEKHGVNISYIQQQTSGGDTYIIDFRYKNIDKDDVAIDKRNTEIKNGIDTEVYPEISNIDKNFITYQSIGSTAANDLLSKAGIAVAVSTLLILIYIMFRFTMVSGIAAILALLHDVVILFALTVICRVQINTSFIAAIITIIAYSINNTIIIFDRCRENVKPFKGQKNIDYKGIGDESVRANMTPS